MQQNSNETSARYLRQSEAVQRTGLSASWFERARWAGCGPLFSKLENGAVLYPEKEFNEYFAARLVSSTTDASEKNLLGRKPSQSAPAVTTATVAPQIETAPTVPVAPAETDDDDLFA